MQNVSMTPDTDLFIAGVLDSLSFTELVTHVETKTGMEIDFLAVDPDKINSLSGLTEQLCGATEMVAA